MNPRVRAHVFALLSLLAWCAAGTHAPAQTAPPIDVWLDVDTANGAGDVDDGLMMIQAFHSPQLNVRGVSTQFGNSTLAKATPIAQHIIDRYAPPAPGSAPAPGLVASATSAPGSEKMIAHPGAASADDLGRETDAVRAMAAALRDKPMHILAVGPVTNAATLLKLHPELHDRIESIVMVAARRPGQKFIVSDTQGAPFRDANFEKDVPGMQIILDSDVPIVFAPWEVSTFVWLRADDMKKLLASGGSGEWVERTSRYWLLRWKQNMDVDGFTPFDMLAVSWFTDRDLLKAMPVSVSIETGPDDGARPIIELGRVAGRDKPYLLVREPEAGERQAIYIYEALPQLKDKVVAQLMGRPGEPGTSDGPLWGSGTATFDHAKFDAVLKKVVDERGLVDYAALAADPAAMDAYIASLADVDLDALTRDERLALLINAYNAFTLRLILDHRPVASIKDIPEAQRWKAQRWMLGGKKVSLDMIEHWMIRPVFNDPRIHFALVCAGTACPPLRGEAYTGDKLEAQLQDQTRRVHAGEPWFVYDAAKNELTLTPLYKWFGSDFVADGGSVLPWIAAQLPDLAPILTGERPPTVVWAEYDWSLNSSRPGEAAE